MLAEVHVSLSPYLEKKSSGVPILIITALIINDEEIIDKILLKCKFNMPVCFGFIVLKKANNYKL